MQSREEARQIKNKSLEFEANWYLDKESRAVIQENWRESGSETMLMHTFRHKLSHCREELTYWSMGKFGNQEDRLKKRTKRLEILQMNESQITKKR